MEESKTPPIPPDSEELVHHFLNNTQKSIIQQCNDYIILSCTTSRPHLLFPDKVTIKRFKQDSTQGESELQALQRLGELYTGSIPVPYFYCSRTCNKSLHLFVGHLEKSLAIEISDRRAARKFWTESELWRHLESISKAVYYLHTLRLVHRNITPHSLFLKNDKLFLFNFECCKELTQNATINVATIRGTDEFLSPQAVKAENGLILPTYEISRKDDVWGLGRTLLDMATLTINREIHLQYGLTQARFEEHLRTLLGNRYSSMLKYAVCKLMVLSDRDRPHFEDFYMWLKSNIQHGKCSTCEAQVETVWPCHHFFCKPCLERQMLAMFQSSRAEIVLCSCGIPVPIDFFEGQERTKEIADLILNPLRPCVRKCGANYRVMTGDRGSQAPYYVTCGGCRVSFCSYCQSLKEHKIFGVRKRCPKFSSLFST